MFTAESEGERILKID